MNKKKQNISILDSLNASGVYVENESLIHEVFSHYKGKETEIFAEILRGKKISGFKSKEKGTALLLRDLLLDVRSSKVPTLYITHDSILALFVGTLTKQIIDGNNWFDYLDGICIKKTASKYNLYWGNNKFDITSKCTELLQSIEKRFFEPFSFFKFSKENSELRKQSTNEECSFGGIRCHLL